MGIAVFFLLALVVAGIVAYPLLENLTGRGKPAEPVAATDTDIDRAVANLRKARSQAGPSCPACGRAYQPGDRFCVRCGHDLPGEKVASPGPTCPSCGADIHAEDQFCAKCGHRTGVGEAA